MKRIFITGSADGLGQLAAKKLVEQGHEVVLHARNDARAREALDAVPGARDALAADLESQAETIELASKVNDLGRFDAIIHNAAVYKASGEDILAINILAPYILSCLITPPERLVYMSSGMHGGGNVKLESLRTGHDEITYSDSKLYMVMLARYIARAWPGVFANAVDPGWVPTKMGGAGAPDDLEEGVATQVWLASSDDAAAKVTGQYFHHQRIVENNPQADDVALQDALIEVCGKISGVQFPVAAKATS